MNSPKDRILSLIQSPGTWELVLGCHAALAVMYLYVGIQGWLTDIGLIAVALTVCALVPYLFFMWGRKVPTRGLAKDVRVWLLTLVGLVGLGLALYRVDSSSLLDTLTLLLFMPVVIVACLWAYLRYLIGHGTALAKAHQTGWRLSEEEIDKLGVEQTLLQEMTPAQRLRHNIIILSGFVVFLVAIGFLLMCKVPPLEGYTALWVIFILHSALLTSYYSRLLRNQFVQKKRTALELSVARQMQMALLPVRDPEVEGFDIAGTCIPAEEVGGDLYAYFGAPSGKKGFGVALADVSGKAMKAAIATVLVSGMLRLESGHSERSSEMLGRLNRALLGGMDPFMFVAMQVLVLDPETGSMRYSNAGQVHPLLLRGGALSQLELNALPLGLVEGSEYASLELDLEPGDSLFLVSDGVTEAMDERRELFGSERLERTLLALDLTRSARLLLEDILAAVDSFRGKAPPSDDRTVVVVKRLP